MGLHKDEIVDEVRKVRQAYAAKFNYDLERIFKDLRKKQKVLKGFKFFPRVISQHNKV